MVLPNDMQCIALHLAVYIPVERLIGQLNWLRTRMYTYSYVRTYV